MEELKSFFFDTYAFYEIIEGNNNYKKYIKDVAIVTTKLNLMELHYGIMLSYGEDVANKYYDKYLQYTVKITDDIIKMANKLKMTFKKRKLSYVDCVGYVLANSMGIKFLTGDNGFFDIENVAFVK